MQTLVIDNMFGESVLMIKYTCDNRPSGPYNPTGCKKIRCSHFVFMFILRGGSSYGLFSGAATSGKYEPQCL